ncbi:hypothetical protein DVH26_07680 [Paenibacillus sp. H1-7]|uniref:hypothetical protein n=1 Tax=Paenibacillus sp. H1-7 TaxID=2282849 RepID=UPI001EF755F8|nr:hypothetical protein [Paenibacillus sp. H1-7]ULL14338.1 hypothetical protein DVH26_07680 [Paenibacillus sp. H1-7]
MKAIITVTAEIEIDVPNEYYPPECDTDEKRLAYEIESYDNGEGDIMQLLSTESKMTIVGKVIR